MVTASALMVIETGGRSKTPPHGLWEGRSLSVTHRRTQTSLTGTFTSGPGARWMQAADVFLPSVFTCRDVAVVT